MIFTQTNRATARFLAVLTALSMILSAFPASFFVAEAATSVSFSLYVTPNPIGSDPDLEYITISNTSGQDVDMTGWKLVEGTDELALSGTFAGPSDTLACANDNFAENGGKTCAFEFPVGFDLVNTGGSVQLVAPDGTTIVDVSWGNLSGTESDASISGSGSLSGVLAKTGGDKIDICHATASASNPYNAISPNLNSFFSGHDTDTDDIIPPFYYDNGSGVQYFEGNNWDTEGEAWLNNRCEDPNSPQDTTSSETIVVRAADLAQNAGDVVSDPTSWFFYNDESDTIDSSLGSFVNGPATAPLGDGSAEITVSGTQRRNLATYQFSGVELSDITELKFSTYNPSAGNGGSTNRSAYINFNVDFDDSDTWQKRIAFVPNQNGSVSQDSWQQWDAIDGGSALWWWSGYENNGDKWPDDNTDEYRTWDDLLASFPDIAVRTTDSWFGMRVGEPYADGYTEEVDEFIIGVDQGTNIHTTTFDFEPDATSDVTICKIDEEQNGLADWTLMLDGGHIEDVIVLASNSSGVDTSAVFNADTSYYAVAAGTWLNARNPDNYVDAEYSTEDDWATHMDGFDGYGTDILELSINEELDPGSVWGPYNSTHEYAQAFVPNTDGVVNLHIDDSNYADNSGSIDVSLYEGYAGVTGGDGCVTFDEVPYGTYSVQEIIQEGWHNVSGLVEVEVDNETEEFTVTNSDNLNVPVCDYGFGPENLLSNGSFEEPLADASSHQGGFFETFASITGWTSTNGFELWNNLFGTASDGEQNAELDVDESTTITQNVATIPGATYELRFDFSPRTGTGLADNSVDALVDSAVLMNVSGDGSSLTENTWTTYSEEFEATGTTTEISFADKGTSNGLGSLMDNAVLCLVEEPQPIECTVTIVSDESNTVVEKGGAFAQALSFVHSGWTAVIPDATWIWGDDPITDPSSDETQTFEKKFGWNGNVTSATLYVASDNSHEATLNTSTAGIATDEQNFRITDQDQYDVTGLINQGNNELSIAVKNWAGDADPQSNPAGLLYKLEITGTVDEEGACNIPYEEPELDLCIIDGYKFDEEGNPLEGWAIGLFGAYSYQDDYSAPWLVGADTTDSDGYYCIEEDKYEVPKGCGFDVYDDAPLQLQTINQIPFETVHFVAEDLAPQSGWEGLWVDIDQTGTTTPESDYYFPVFTWVDLDEDERVDFYNTDGDGGSGGEDPVCEADVNLIENGGFEAPVVDNEDGWDIFKLSEYPAVVWVVEFVDSFAGAPDEASIELHAGVEDWTPSEGAQYTELDSDWQGPGTGGQEKASVKISQTIETIPGEEYTLSWDFSPRPGQVFTENKLEVFVDGSEVAQNQVSGAGLEATEWTPDSYTFVATGDETTVAFADAGEPNSIGTFVDNVALVCNPDDNGGGNGSDEDTYRIEGYVWHDDNGNTEWDGLQEENPTENPQAGWTVRITNGTDTYATTTNSDGFFYFEVPEGTWTLTEEVQNGWELTTPVSGSYVITVPEVVTQSFAERIFAMIVPTAHAAVVSTVGEIFLFGNNEVTTFGGTGGGGGDYISLSSSSSADGEVAGEETGTPTVLGEQISLIPEGAPNAGAGGSQKTDTPYALLAIFTGLAVVQLMRKHAQ